MILSPFYHFFSVFGGFSRPKCGKGAMGNSCSVAPVAWPGKRRRQPTKKCSAPRSLCTRDTLLEKQASLLIADAHVAGLQSVDRNLQVLSAERAEVLLLLEKTYLIASRTSNELDNISLVQPLEECRFPSLMPTFAEDTPSFATASMQSTGASQGHTCLM